MFPNPGQIAGARFSIWEYPVAVTRTFIALSSERPFLVLGCTKLDDCGFDLAFRVVWGWKTDFAALRACIGRKWTRGRLRGYQFLAPGQEPSIFPGRKGFLGTSSGNLVSKRPFLELENELGDRTGAASTVFQGIESESGTFRAQFGRNGVCLIAGTCRKSTIDPP